LSHPTEVEVQPASIVSSTSAGDRNFDDLAHRFQRNVYSRLKGMIRLAVLRRDLHEALPQLPAPAPEGELRIFDAGGGQGPLSLELASQGHHVALCDISARMLDLAAQRIAAEGLGERVTLHHMAIQDFCARQTEHFDLVLCHAVLEWVADPRALLDSLCAVLKPGGLLSLSFYNIHGLAMKNLLRGNFAKVLAEDYRGFRGSLTPPDPPAPAQVFEWLTALGLEQVCYSGIRCFHDYLLDPALRESSPEAQLALELRLSRQEPFRALGRYLHLLVQRPAN